MVIHPGETMKHVHGYNAKMVDVKHHQIHNGYVAKTWYGWFVPIINQNAAKTGFYFHDHTHVIRKNHYLGIVVMHAFHCCARVLLHVACHTRTKSVSHDQHMGGSNSMRNKNPVFNLVEI